MKVDKRIIGELEKCYSLAPLDYKGEKCFLVAAEKKNQCRLYDSKGTLTDVIWEEPGGTMSMVQVPGSDGQFLATQRFYSPNDSREASIVLVTPRGKNWEIHTLVRLPFVHRFDILSRKGRHYLIACTLKSDHRCKDDWSCPGKVYGGMLPENLGEVDEEHPLELEVLKDQMYRNHGYSKSGAGGEEWGLVSCEQGVYRFCPPKDKGGQWEIQMLIEDAASDAVLVDLDGCGEEELFLFTPFHGNKIRIYKNEKGIYRRIYESPQPLKFLHALERGTWNGKAVVFAGYRKGERNLMMFIWSPEDGYRSELIDEGRGPANVLYLRQGERDVLLAANRETDEIAMYTLEG